MRKLTFTLFTFSSLVVANAQLNNGNLETWVSNQWSPNPPAGSGTTYNEPGSGTTRTTHFFRTLNELNDLPSPLTIPQSCWRTDTAHEGSYAARVRSQQFSSYFIPGFLGTGDIDIASQTLYLGRQYTSHPDSFSTWYKYAGVGGDSAKFEVSFTKYDALNQVSNVIGHGSATILNNTSTWTQLKFAINWTSSDAPDTAIVIGAASGGYNLSNFLASVGDAGSQLWIDDMMLWSGNIGIEEEYINENVHIFPNPASDFVNITTTGLAQDLKLFVYDMNGKQIMAKVITGNSYLLDVTTLPNGVYGVVIQDNFNPIHRSKFIKK